MSTTTAQAWLLIAHGGGRWTTREVMDSLSCEPVRTVENTIFRMGQRGFVKVYAKDGTSSRMRFGVTGDCRIPRGVTAWEVTQAMGMQLRPNVDESEVVGGKTVHEVLQAMAVQREAA
jgi:hypothetical protein